MHYVHRNLGAMINKLTIAGSLAVLFWAGSQLYAQTDSLSYRQCMKLARENAVLKGNSELLDELARLKMENYQVSNMPQLSAFGKATYQSEAIAITLPGGMALEMDPFQYNTGLEAQQKLYDGGLSGKMKKVEASARQAELNKLDAELYQVNRRVSQLFFTVLLLEKQDSVWLLKARLLEARVAALETASRQGVAARNQVEKIYAEAFRVQQQRLEVQSNRLKALGSLSLLCGQTFYDEVQLVVADSGWCLPAKNRPELDYFGAEVQKLESLAGLQQAKNRPKLYAFGQTGYSYPGLNFYTNEPAFYYLVGAKLSWTLFDWKQNQREVQYLRIQEDLMRSRSAEFKQNQELALREQSHEKEKLLALIELDVRLVEQYASISRGSAAALDKGTITSADYLEDLNQEVQARLTAETHKLQLQQSLVEMKLLEGVAVPGL